MKLSKWVGNHRELTSQGGTGIPLIDPSTWKFLGFCGNLLIRAGAVAICWFVMLQLGILLNNVLKSALKAFEVGGATQDFVRFMPIAYVVGLAVCITVTGLWDAVLLTYTSLRQSGGGAAKEQSDETRTKHSG